MSELAGSVACGHDAKSAKRRSLRQRLRRSSPQLPHTNNVTSSSGRAPQLGRSLRLILAALRSGWLYPREGFSMVRTRAHLIHDECHHALAYRTPRGDACGIEAVRPQNLPQRGEIHFFPRRTQARLAALAQHHERIGRIGWRRIKPVRAQRPVARLLRRFAAPTGWRIIWKQSALPQRRRDLPSERDVHFGTRRERAEERAHRTRLAARSVHSLTARHTIDTPELACSDLRTDHQCHTFAQAC